MRHYIAIIHKDLESGYGASFPDVPGVITVGDTIDETIAQAGEVLAFAAEDWEEHTGAKFPAPRTIDELRKDDEFIQDSADALLAVIPLPENSLKHAAE